MISSLPLYRGINPSFPSNSFSLLHRFPRRNGTHLYSLIDSSFKLASKRREECISHTYFTNKRGMSCVSDQNLRKELSRELNESVSMAFPQLNEKMIKGMGRIDMKRGGYSTPLALSLSKKLGMKPNEIANKLMDQLKDKSDQSNSLIQSTQFHEESGQINVQLKAKILSERIHQMAALKANSIHSNSTLFVSCLQSLYKTEKKRNILVDFGSPNMCKELHVGHLRSIILGDSISRILEYLGHKVERISHVGDFGTPVAMVICHAFDQKLDFAENCRREGSDILQSPDKWPSPSLLSSIYVDAKNRSKTDPDFLERSKQIAKMMQDINNAPKEIQLAWKVLCEASRKGFGKVFESLGVVAEERGESHYAPLLNGIIDELNKKGITQVSEGAVCIFLPNFKAPFIIQKSDGAYLYATTDLAALKSRVESGKDWIVYVTDDSQSRHFEQVFKVSEMAGWLDRSKVRVDHVPFGVMKGGDGRKLSSRDGSPYPLENLLVESISKVSTNPELIEQRNATISQKDLTERIAFNAIKYYDLCHGRDYVFSFEDMLSLKGNTAVYLMYAYARICSIKEQFKLRTGKDYVFQSEFLPVLEHPNEISLVMWVTRFPEILETIEQSLSPQLLCEYLFELASQFHSFYGSCRIIDDPQQESRMQLCLAVEAVLETGLQLVGLKPSEVI